MDDEEFHPYPYDFCSSCMWRAGDLLDMCTFCDSGDQYEEAELADGEEPYLAGRRVIRIKEFA